jgi:thiol-disulfide isomerase/thioredoxin
MKRIGLIVFLLSSLLALGGEIRTWNTAKGGLGTEAAFLGVKSGQVALEKSGGQKVRISLASLCRIDRDYVALEQKKDAREIPSAIKALFGSELVNADGQPVAPATLAGKKIGVYFSAAWCPPCRAFTPKLVAAYQTLREEGQPFELVFVSSDRDQAAARQYMQDYGMIWPAVPHGSDRVAALKEKFGVQGIPMLVIVDAAGKTLSTHARFEVMQKGARAFDHW